MRVCSTVGVFAVLMTAVSLIGCASTSPTSAAPAGADSAPMATAGTVPVTVDNFTRAETDLYLSHGERDGAFGKYYHIRTPTPIDKQGVIRMNRDTLYSSAFFDLDAGPVTITMPDSGKRFMSLMVINQDHYVQDVFYGSGKHTLDRASVGTRYGFTAVRTLVDPNDPKDVEEVHKLQDAIKVEQPGGPGKFEVPKWDPVSQTKVRDALLVLSSTTSGFNRAFGKKEDVDPIRHLLGTAAGWGGNPDKDAIYVGVTPPMNDGKQAYKLVVKDVPVDAFWSISVYNAKGYFEKNAKDAYTVNNITAKPDADGSVTIHFGGDEGAPNMLPITPGWNFLVRLYRPRAAILDGTWKFPEPTPVK